MIEKKSRHILFVEDNPELRDATADMLDAMGYRVSMATDVTRALDLANRHAFDLLVANAYPTEGTGVQTVAHVRQAVPSLPALLLSGFGEDPELRHLAEAGEVGFLAIPFTGQTLATEIESCFLQRPSVPFPTGSREEVPAADQAGRKPMEQSTWVQNGSRLAVAAALILGAGIAFRLIGNQRPAGPGLPAPVIGDVRRGSDLELVEPIGDLETLPTQLVWKEWSGAASYRVSLRGVDPQPLWESTAKTVAISLPLELQQQMHRAVTYRWQVQALDNNQVTLGVSLEKTFSARPTARALESVPQGEETGKE